MYCTGPATDGMIVEANPRYPCEKSCFLQINYLYASMNIWKRHDCKVKTFSGFFYDNRERFSSSVTSLRNCKLPFIVKSKIHRTKIRKRIAALLSMISCILRNFDRLIYLWIILFFWLEINSIPFVTNCHT